MKRPLLLVSLFFMAGIILNGNIIWTALFAVLFFTCFFVKKEFNILISLIVISFIAGSTYIKIYESIYTKEIQEYHDITTNIIGTVYSKLDMDTYLIRDVTIGNRKIRSNIRISAENLNIGNKISATAKLSIPNRARNTGGFNYRRYLKTQKIYLTAKTYEVNIIKDNDLNVIENISEKIRKKVREFTSTSKDVNSSGILLSLIIGDDTTLEEELEENYKKAGMIHLLVVSGGHVAFLILLINYILKLLKIGVRENKFIMIIIIAMYVIITGCTPSILRAGIACIIVIISEIIGRENDTPTTVGLVVLILLLENPNIIYSLSFQLSFLGAIGIILIYPKITLKFNKMAKSNKIINVILKVITEAIALTFSAQLLVTPITLYNFNTIYLGGLVSNIFSMSLAGIIMMGGVILFFIYLISPTISNILMPVIELLIKLMNLIAKVFSNIPFLNYTFPTPSIYQIIIYYILVLYIFDIDYKILINSSSKNTTLPMLYRKKFITKSRVVICGVISILIISVAINILPRGLEISVIDVGHGDSILITTPHRKTILIDTGDSYTNKGKTYDTGESTVVPYILDKGFSKVDLLILTHIDSDHTGGLKSIIESLDVKKIGISINSDKKEGFSEISNIISKKNVETVGLQRGEEIDIDGVKLSILHPSKEAKVEEENNDSVVMLMEYQGVKALFMGDLEKEKEKELIKSTPNLDVDILKVGHHGSITSTSEELAQKTTPRVALISVGNRYKSIPSDKVLNRLENVYSRIYRTDKMGEISVKIKNGKIYVGTKY